MELKLKADLQEAYIWVPFVNSNVMGKFIEEGLYPHLYEIAPELFEVKQEKKTKSIDDLYIDNSVE